jgi:beta-lactam-binding protein with PASTA domain
LNLTVSSGTAKVEVPDVKGELASEAQPKLEAIGFTVETDEVAGSGRPPGEVISQDPAAGQEAARKSVVKLTVASAANMISGSRTRRKYSYRIEVPTDMPDRVDLRVVMLDASGEEVVFEDRVNPGFIATVERDGYGDKVRFITRINGVTVDEVETGPEQEVEN